MHRLALDLRQVLFLDARERVIGQVPLRRFGRAQDARHRAGLVGHVDRLAQLQVLQNVRDDLLVEVVAAQVVVAVAGNDLDHAILDPYHRDIERPATQVVNQDSLALVLTGFIDERCGGRLVDDTHHLQSGDLAGLARRLALGVREIRRHGDHRLAHRVAQPGFGDLLQSL